MFKPNSYGAGLWAPVLLAVSIAAFGPASFVAQTPSQQKTEPKQGMGVSTGDARTYTSRRTVGITDPRAPVIFEDVTARTSLAKFRHRSGGPDKNYILDAPSGGV